MSRQRSFDLKTILRYQRRRSAWYYWSQWIVIIATFIAAILALLSALLSLFPTQWLIVMVAFCSGFAQLVQAIIQMKLNPPQRNPGDQLLQSMKQGKK